MIDELEGALPRWWHRDMAVRLAVEMEKWASMNSLHVALTGGLLYKLSPRKDADFVIYRHNLPESIDTPKDLAERRANFEGALVAHLKMQILGRYGYLTKVLYQGMGVDIMYPELRKPGEEYMNQDVGPINTGDGLEALTDEPF